MQRRIMGMENELGAIYQQADGTWEPVAIYAEPLKTILMRVGILSPEQAVLRTYALASELWRQIGIGGDSGHHLATEYRRVLPNGGCVYPDVGHLEYATPECLTVRDLVAASRGGLRWIEAHIAAHPTLGRGRIFFLKDNTDPKDEVSFGCHENYLFDMDRIPFDPMGFSREHGKLFATFLATRIVFTGSGAVHARISSPDLMPRGMFLLSPRARFLDKLYNSSTTVAGHAMDRPLINTRMEPLGMVRGRSFQRLHLICGDPNMSELVDFLKFGTMHLLLRLAEEVEHGGSAIPAVRYVLDTLHAINKDLSLAGRFQTRDGGSLSALDIQEAYLEAIAAHFPRDDDPDDVRQETEEILERWAHVLSGLRRNPRTLVRDLDWVHKMVLEERWLQDHGVDSFEHLQRLFHENPPRAQDLLDQLKGLEQRFHELSPRGLWRMQERAGRVTRLVTDQEIEYARDDPPGHTNPSCRCRSWARGMLVQWAEAHSVRPLISMNWQNLWLYLGDSPFSGFGPVLCVRMPNPFLWDVSLANQLRVID